MRGGGYRRSRSARIVASALVAIGVLLGAALVLAAVPAPALADCVSYKTNVEGYDYQIDRFGIGGEIYVNTQSTLSNLQAEDYRSFFVFHDINDWTEVGWGANAYGHTSPTDYVFWDNNGAKPSQPEFFNSLSYDTYYFVKNQDQYGDKVFHFYVNGSELDKSPTMGFYKGYILTNSEHHNSCDSMWTHMYDLEYYNEHLNWVSPLGNLELYCDNSNGNWLLNIISNSELYVDQQGGVWGC